MYKRMNNLSGNIEYKQPIAPFQNANSNRSQTEHFKQPIAPFQNANSNRSRIEHFKQPIIPFQNSNSNISQVEHFKQTIIPFQNTNINRPQVDHYTENPDVHIRFDQEEEYNTASPQVFGPPMWFTLHNAAAHYPENPSPLTRERMKQIIIGLPVLIPCQNCSEHATAHIEKFYDQLDQICSSRDSLFKFFVDFHNYVNKRYNKPLMSYEKAYKLYTGTANISRMTYS